MKPWYSCHVETASSERFSQRSEWILSKTALLVGIFIIFAWGLKGSPKACCICLNEIAPMNSISLTFEIPPPQSYTKWFFCFLIFAGIHSEPSKIARVQFPSNLTPLKLTATATENNPFYPKRKLDPPNSRVKSFMFFLWFTFEILFWVWVFPMEQKTPPKKISPSNKCAISSGLFTWQSFRRFGFGSC